MLLQRIVRELKKNNLPDFLRKVLFYSVGKGRLLWALDERDWQKKKVLAQKAFAHYPRGSTHPDSPTIVYVLPGTWIAGGIAVVLQQANRLQERGYRVFVVTQDLKRTIPWFSNQNVPVIPIQEIETLLKDGIDILIATGWNSAPTVDLLPAARKLYFVQQDERKFYTNRVQQLFVGSTYELPFEYVTMARWIQRWLRDEFRHDSKYVPNGLDRTIFQPSDPIEPRGKRVRVLIEGPIDIPFKGMADAYQAIRDLDCELWIVSGRGSLPSGWRCDRFFEGVPLDEMPKIYSSCDILLKMSTVESFAYPPLEMMACGGVPVIRRVSGIEEYAIDEENCLIVEDIEGAKRAVSRLLADGELRKRLAANGLKTAQNWSWSQSIDALEHAFSLK